MLVLGMYALKKCYTMKCSQTHDYEHREQTIQLLQYRTGSGRCEVGLSWILKRVAGKQASKKRNKWVAEILSRSPQFRRVLPLSNGL